MNESDFGDRDGQGHWRPSKPITYPAVFTLPINPGGFLQWLKAYLLGWNLGYALIALTIWLFLSPPLESFRHLSAGTVLWVFARNALLVLLFFGAYHFRLYTQRAQGTQFKYNPEWLANDRSTFLFRNQTIDNLIWTFLSAVPLWTAYEVVSLWAMASGTIAVVSWAADPLYIIGIMLVIPLFRELHFYATHRLIHWGPLYRSVHSLHHKNRNPGPWSGLAMHPGEHLLYFSGVLLHWVVASHPVHVIYHLVHLGLAPAAGHAGFDKVVMRDGKAMDTHGYAHYLHHKHFECNYVDGTIPLDKWFGSFHDGSEASYTRLRKRLSEKRGLKRERNG